MDIILIILWTICIIVGILGSVLPILPGPIIAFAGLLLLQFTSHHPFTRAFLIVRALVVVVINLMDYYVPIRWTKKFGGTKWWMRGSAIGLVVGVIVLPLLSITIWPFGLWGLIAWPFLGAYLGEKIWWRQHHLALRSAVGSFIGFLTGTLAKLVVCIVMAVYFFIQVYSIIFT